MKLSEIEIQGRLCIFLRKIYRLEMKNYCDQLKEDFYHRMNETSFRFYSTYLKRDRKMNSYPFISEDDLNPENISSLSAVRFNRLKNLSSDLYSFSLRSTGSEIPKIIEFAKNEKLERVIIFHSKNLLRDEKRLLQIMKMNSFLYNRDANLHYAGNLFNPTGYIRKNKLEMVLKGKARLSSPATFLMIELELDQEFSSNLVTIKYVKEAV